MTTADNKIDKHDLRRHHIIHAAIKRFLHFGLHKTSMADVAKAAQISKSLLYYYFNSKETLILASLASITTTFSPELERTNYPNETIEEIFFAKTDAWHQFYIANRPFFDYYFDSKINDIDRQEIQRLETAVNKKLLDILCCILKEHVDKGMVAVADPYSFVDLLLNALSFIRPSMTRSFDVFRPMSAQDLALILENQKKIISVFLQTITK